MNSFQKLAINGIAALALAGCSPKPDHLILQVEWKNGSFGNYFFGTKNVANERGITLHIVDTGEPSAPVIYKRTTLQECIQIPYTDIPSSGILPVYSSAIQPISCPKK